MCSLWRNCPPKIKLRTIHSNKNVCDMRRNNWFTQRYSNWKNQDYFIQGCAIFCQRPLERRLRFDKGFRSIGQQTLFSSSFGNGWSTSGDLEMYVAQVRKHAFGQNDVNLFLLCRKYNLENDYNAVRVTPSLWQNTRIKKSSSGSLASIEGIKMYEPGYNLTRSTNSFLLIFVGPILGTVST